MFFPRVQENKVHEPNNKTERHPVIKYITAWCSR